MDENEMESYEVQGTVSKPNSLACQIAPHGPCWRLGGGWRVFCGHRVARWVAGGGCYMTPAAGGPATWRCAHSGTPS